MKFDEQYLYKSLAKSDIGRKRVQTVAKNRLALLRPELLKQFDDHEVTVEINAGAGTTNVSNTLGGQGDLFSFIGFDEGTRPTDAVRKVIESETELIISSAPARLDGTSIVYKFNLKIPTASIEAASPLPFESGQSWVTGITKGISGFSQYLAGYFSSSRSGGGVQSANIVRSGGFNTREYISEVYRNFAASFKRK